jgi:2-methylcitrate dehydratase PrpD
VTTASENLSENIVNTNFESFSKQDIEFAKNRLADVIGCALGGAFASNNNAVMELVKEWGGKKEATILGYGIRAPAHNVAMANSVMVRSFDYEPSGYYFRGMAFPCHSSSVTSITALTMAEHLKSSGKELLTALILADDFLARLTAAADWTYAIDDTPWDCSGTMSKWGAAAVAGKLLKLNKKQMKNAFGIVVDTVQCTKQGMVDGSDTYKLHSGLACRDGIMSAKLASKGFTGLKDPLLSKFGFLPSYFPHYLTLLPDVLTKELGEKFYSGAGIGHKFYPCCGGNDLYVECTLQIIRKHNIDPQKIAEILVGTIPNKRSTVIKAYGPEVAGQVEATFNVSYNIANILLRKSVTKLEHFTEEAVREPEIFNLTKKIKFVPMETSPEKGVQVTVNMKNGVSVTEFANSFKGGPGKQLTKDEIKEKFRGNIAFSKMVALENTEKAWDMLDHLEEIDNVAKITKLMVAKN